MRVIGILLLIVALLWLGYALFALAWDGGTARATDDKIQAAMAAVLALGAAGMIARQSWGWMLCAAAALAVVVFFALALMASSLSKPKPVAGPLLLKDLPSSESALATRLDAAWWAASVAAIRQREADNDAIARPWAIQGDDSVRLLVLHDLRVPLRDEKYFPLDFFLVLNTAKGTVAARALERFYSADRAAPAELQLSVDGGGQRAKVVARSDKECVTRTFTIDRAAGTLTPLASAAAC